MINQNYQAFQIFKIWKVLSFFVLVSFTSCIDEITFDPAEQVQTQLVVDGNITTHPGPHILKLSSTRKDELSKPIPVIDAQITIFDDLGNSEDYLQMGFKDGEYHLLNEVVKGEVGRTYFIEITLRDGSVFRSDPEELRPVPKMSDIEVKFEQETEFTVEGLAQTNNFANVYINTPIPNTQEGVFLKWEAFGDWLLVDRDDPCDPFDAPTACYFNDDLTVQGLGLFNSKELEVNELNDWFVGKRTIDYSFQFKQYFSVFQSSLTPRAFTFFEQIASVSSIEGNLFDEPPAAVSGNLFNINDSEERVLGYFSASEVDTIRMFLVRENLPVAFKEFCPIIWPRPPCNDICYECERLDGASTIKPDFFE